MVFSSERLISSGTLSPKDLVILPKVSTCLTVSIPRSASRSRSGSSMSWVYPVWFAIRSVIWPKTSGVFALSAGCSGRLGSSVTFAVSLAGAAGVSCCATFSVGLRYRPGLLGKHAQGVVDHAPAWETGPLPLICFSHFHGIVRVVFNTRIPVCLFKSKKAKWEPNPDAEMKPVFGNPRFPPCVKAQVLELPGNMGPDWRWAGRSLPEARAFDQ